MIREVRSAFVFATKILREGQKKDIAVPSGKRNRQVEAEAKRRNRPKSGKAAGVRPGSEREEVGF